jgi:hypothetical protein
MARRAALQSELSRCEAELRMLGSQKPVKKVEFVVGERVDRFINAMKNIAEKSTNNFAKAALRMWCEHFRLLLCNINQIKLFDSASGRAMLNADELVKSITWTFESIYMIGVAFEGMDLAVCKLCDEASIGIRYGIPYEGQPAFINNHGEKMSHVSKVLQHMGRAIRQIHCDDGKGYSFLGSEAETLMIASFDILDPYHDVTRRNPLDPNDTEEA